MIERVTGASVDRLWRMVARYQDANAVQVRDDAESLARYVEPPSRALLATVEGRDAGCVLLRPLAVRPGACEIKRLFVEPERRGRGVARALVEALLEDAAELGYAWVYLDTAADMTGAQALYERLGFRDCPPYNDNPQASRFMRLSL
jgi:ribosomal protein S18 acetylase RimI-like enzyme